MALLEPIAVASALASVWLLLRKHIANWPAGLVSVACYGVVFVDAKLYADALLQAAFFGFGVAGWLRWHKDGPADGTFAVTRAGARQWAAAAAIATAGILAVAGALATWTDSPLPVADSAIFVLSLLAIWWQSLKRLEHWWLWIAVDVISIPVYASRGLPLTAALYAGFLVLCIAGLLSWRTRPA